MTMVIINYSRSINKPIIDCVIINAADDAPHVS